MHSEQVDFGSVEASPFDVSAISFESNENNQKDGSSENIQPITAQSANEGNEVDFSDFSFGNSELESEPEPVFTPQSAVPEDDFSFKTTEPETSESRQDASHGFDFTDEGMFGAADHEAAGKPVTFNYDVEISTVAMEIGDLDSSNKSDKIFSFDTSEDAPFNSSEINYGEELTPVTVPQDNQDTQIPTQDNLITTQAEEPDKRLDNDVMPTFTVADTPGDHPMEELPPLLIASRRRQSPILGALTAVIAVLVISVLGYFGYSAFSTPKEVVIVEAGKISVRGVKAIFIKNAVAGELLVVSGEALNEYPKPRAALQVKVTVFDASGQSIGTKNVYGGNPLTDEQLKSLPLDKIEAVMANQFGDSLANMEVPPGKAIPFVAVLATIPEGAKDFSVQPAGSTVATGKQQ